jgi:PleD family two-component response regulator
VTCSVGLACWDFQEDSSKLLERADQALYAAKAEGRNRYVLAS